MFHLRSLFIFCLIGIFSGFVFAAESESRLSLTPPTNFSKRSQVGFGVQAGSLSGANAQFWISESRTANACITYDGGNTALGLSHDWIVRGAFGDNVPDLAPFWGVGVLGAVGRRADVFLRGEQSFALALQVPVGLEWLPRTQRFSIFGEVVPLFEATPVASLILTADVGGRYYF